MVEKQFVVYIISNFKNGTNYTRITTDLVKRIWQHKNEHYDGFTAEHGLKLLVWYEVHENAESAIHREKRLKKYTRDAKIKLIEKENKSWNDLYNTICK
jgi:putative endonuclease